MSEHYDWVFGSYKDKDMVYKNLHNGIKRRLARNKLFRM